MADFEEAYRIVLKNEGGYANLKNDSGGETWKGIARNFWPIWEGWPMIDKKKDDSGFPANLKQVPGLDGMVESFYRQHFWVEIRGDRLPQINADDVMDLAVNKGVHRAIALFQDALGVPITNKMDEVTLNKINGLV